MRPEVQGVLEAMKQIRACASILALIGIGLGCGGEESPPAADVVRPVKTFVFAASQRAQRLSYPARVYADQTVEVAFEVTGKLAELPVAKGQEVKRGDLLAQLDQRDFRNELAAA